MFPLLIICAGFVTAVTDVAQGKLLQLPEGYSFHPVSLTWEEANEECISEGGILASPITEQSLTVLKSVIDAKDLTYHIGTKAFDSPGKYVSIEGVPLENMAVVFTDLVQQLKRSQGDCLSMDRNSIRVIPCRTELPYICYKTHISLTNREICGPVEEGYTYEEATNSCYRLDAVGSLWNEAQDTCISEGGHLAIIETAEEAKILNKMHEFVNNTYIFIGLRDFSGEGDWVSVNWQYVEKLFNVWVEGRKTAQPNFRFGSLRNDGKLEYVSNNVVKPYICERKPNLCPIKQQKSTCIN